MSKDVVEAIISLARRGSGDRTPYPDVTGQRHVPDAEGRVCSTDNSIFIHAIVPRHVETVVLIKRE